MYRGELDVLNLPVNWLDSICLQEFVALTEVMTSEESAVGGKWRRMWCFQNQVLWIVQHLFLGAGKGTPEHEDNWTVFLIDLLNYGVGELLPALILMGSSCVGPDGEYGVEKENSLLSPFDQIAIVWNLATQVSVQFLINVL